MSHTTVPQKQFKVDEVRQDFPIFFDSDDKMSHEMPIIHLNNAATTHKPFSVINAVSKFYQKDNANVHRASQLLSASATEDFEAARKTVQQFLNARYLEEIIWTKGATESINLVAQSWGKAHLKKGDEILLLVSEHHANILPWQRVAKEVGAVVRSIPVTDDAIPDMQVFASLLNEKTRIVGVGHVSNATGRINPIQKIVTMAHNVNALVLVDGAQAASHFDIDVQVLDCDFYVVSGHKMYGPNGIGMLYGKREHLEAMPPWQVGGGMVSKVSFSEEACFNPLPFKLEAGTPNISAVLGLVEAIHYLQKFDRQSIMAHESQLLFMLYDGLVALPGIRVIGERDNRAGVISFVSDVYHHQDLSLLLSNKGVILRSGHHCAMPLMDCLDLKGTLRVSVAMYTTREDVAAFLQAITEILSLDGSKPTHEVSLGVKRMDKSTQADTIPFKNTFGEDSPAHGLFNELLVCKNWSSRYRDIMRLGKNLPILPEDLRLDEHLIPGCESHVWLIVEYDANLHRINCRSDSDSSVMRGLIALLLSLVDGRPPQTIIEAPIELWFDQLGLMRHLSPTRGNGLRMMLNTIRAKARECLIKNDVPS